MSYDLIVVIEAAVFCTISFSFFITVLVHAIKELRNPIDPSAD